MSFGAPTAPQFGAIRNVVSGRDVIDLGAGDCRLAVMMLQLGARHVIALDKSFQPSPVAEEILQLVGDKKLALEKEDFGIYALSNADDIDVAFISWPANSKDEGGLLSLAARAKTIIYLGSNTDCNQCAGPRLLEHFLWRDLVTHIPSRRNTLLVLGGPLPAKRPPTGEEKAGALAWEGGDVMYYEDAMRLNEANSPLSVRPPEMYNRVPGLSPSESIISSAIVSRVGGHDVVKLWSRGGFSGELTVSAGDGRVIVEKLGLGEAIEDTADSDS